MKRSRNLLQRGLQNPLALGYGVIVLALLLFILWSILAPLSGAVVTVGLVKTEKSRKAVQHAEGGIIKALLVRDGDRVAVGQSLVELDNVGTDSSFRLLNEMAASEAVRSGRLDAEQRFVKQFAQDRTLADLYGERLVTQAYQRELQIFKTRRTGLESQLATLGEQLQAIESERKALQAQINSGKQAIALVEEELRMNRALEEQKFVSRARLLALERGLADYQAKLGEQEAELAQAAQRVNDVKLRMTALKNEYLRLASEEFKESSNRLAELRERLRPASDALQRSVITAPVAGRIVGSRFHGVAQVVGPREILMEIVPDDEELLLEARVSVDAIRDVYVGQHAEMRFTAFNSRTTPVVDGKVSYVAADAVVEKDGAPFYVVQVRPDLQSLAKAGIKLIQPGMAAEIFILTESRTTLDYLLAPVTDILRQSMREK